MPSDPWTPAARAAVERFDPEHTLFRDFATLVVASGSRFIMQGLNQVQIEGRENYTRARELQRGGRGLLTFSNHVGLFDDPWLLACFAAPRWRDLRWISADALNFFGSPLKAAISSMGKAVPIVRGAGIDQPGMRFLSERLEAGDWVHVFPEGGRSREPDATLRLPLKDGLATLVERTHPVLLPFHHRGMHRVLPIGARLPRAGHTVSVRFAEPLEGVQELADTGTEAIMDWATRALVQLEARARA